MRGCGESVTLKCDSSRMVLSPPSFSLILMARLMHVMKFFFLALSLTTHCQPPVPPITSRQPGEVLPCLLQLPTFPGVRVLWLSHTWVMTPMSVSAARFTSL